MTEPSQPESLKPNRVGRLMLGTAQLGMSYGINNKVGLMPETVALELLEAAYREGVRWIDTASTYGGSHALLGKFSRKGDLKIFSKFRYSDGHGGLEGSVDRALSEIGIPRLAGMFLHDFNDVTSHPELLAEASRLKSDGRLGQLGVSVYTNEQIALACGYAGIDCIQMPFNIFDNWEYRGEVISKARNAGKKVFVRSVYLQGLLMMPKVPASLAPLQPLLDRARADAARQGVTFSDFCLLYPFQFPEIDHVILGCESEGQLRSNLDCLRATVRPDYGILGELKVPDRELLNPITWRV